MLTRLRRHLRAEIVLSLLLIVLLTSASLGAAWLSPRQPDTISLRSRLEPPVGFGGTWEYPLGTDARGRDILARLLYGGQVSILIGAASSLVGLALGVALGVIAGFQRGWLDQIIMYLVDVQLSLPFVLLAIAVALVLGTSVPVLVGLAALSTWPLVARVVRGLVLTLRERDYVMAARAGGAGGWHIIRAHLLPNLVAPLLVLGALSVGRVILLESGLSFLGIGVRPPTPSWGNMIDEGRGYLATAWWISTIPGLALALLTIAVGTLGDWLRDVMDVRVST